MIRLILVRHGQTQWTAEQRYQGQSDIPLDDVGLRQADALGRYFAHRRVDAIYSSDLRRAWQTAEPIARAVGIAIQSDPRLREGAFGIWEGLTYGEIQQRWPQQFAAWRSDPLRSTPHGGETLQQVIDRVASVLADLHHNHHNQTIMLVSHGGTLRALFCYALNLPTHAFWLITLNAASISELHLFNDNVAVLSLLNDTHAVADGLMWGG